MYWGEELVAIYNEAYIGKSPNYQKKLPLADISEALLVRNILR